MDVDGSYLYWKQKKSSSQVLHPNASIHPPLSGWESLDGCNAKAVDSKIPTVPQTAINSGINAI